jgi:dephospho-CoA kinase
MNLVLGLTGKRGCGKDTAAKYLRNKYGFKILTYTNDVLAPMLKAQGKEITRENLIKLAIDLRKEFGNVVLSEMICEHVSYDALWVISGVRLPQEVEYMRTRFGEDFKLISIECESKLRYERIRKRGTKGEKELTYDEFLSIEESPTEKPISESMKMADYVLNNDQSKENLYKQIDRLMENLLKKGMRS